MPRDIGTGLYHYPDGTPGNPGQTIFSTRYNTFINDLTNTLNQALPVNMGGTGGDNPTTARDNIDAEVAGAQVTNYDTHVFENGSFYSFPAATAAPVAANLMGCCTIFGAGPDYITIEARDSATGVNYVRRKQGGAWGAWTSNLYIKEAGGNAARITLETTTGGGRTINSYMNGLNRWLLQPGTGDTADDFVIASYDNAGNLAGIPFKIERATQQVIIPATPASGASAANKAYVDSQDSAYSALKVSKAGDGMSGPLLVTPNGSTFGQASGSPGTAVQSEANILLYNYGAANWSGMGSDAGGNFWLRVGIGGSPPPALIIQSTDQRAIFLGAVDVFSPLAVKHNTDPVVEWRLQSGALKAHIEWTDNFPAFRIYCGASSGSQHQTYQDGNTGGWYFPTNAFKPGGGPFTDWSDARIKNVEGDYPRGLDEVLALRPVLYTFKGNDTPDPVSATPGPPSEDELKNREAIVVPFGNSNHYHQAVAGTKFAGLVAQEVEIVMPEMVSQREGYIDGAKVTDLRDIDTTPLIFALINAVKTLAARIEALEAAQATP
jgi:hypothetical protein